MACKVERDETGKVVKIVCSSPWGVGMANSEWRVTYGFPVSPNPNDFTPDAECCSEGEITAWKEACETWNREVGSGQGEG